MENKNSKGVRFKRCGGVKLIQFSSRVTQRIARRTHTHTPFSWMKQALSMIVRPF